MANEYVPLPTLKLALGISDSARDTLLTAALSAASKSIEDHCGRRFWLDADESARIYRPGNRIDSVDGVFIVDDIGDTSGLIVEYGNTADGWTDITSEIELYPENAFATGDEQAVTGLVYVALNGNTWASITTNSRTRIRVTAKWGWPAVPDQIVQATLILAARLYRRKDTPEGIIGSNEWGSVRLSRTDPDVAEQISRFVLLGFA